MTASVFLHTALCKLLPFIEYTYTCSHNKKELFFHTHVQATAVVQAILYSLL